ncbi:class I SAM-dependent methyltransferase [Pannonibacter sp. SL95]|jgi:SAM-dependent methyltransferase|uniref:class I SAM-dependent methyltransferase n=1 Tax=Pannonibacter sp. SL95 TaxID=2995153 RepID=UPI002276BFC6|nr:class I SAM-dependent methyltransferase [Pannonibacter sp. SL95]MCY1705924.1 class I SAM-dependent methyltransferase [Pannonibacter sp. SL95]
MFIPMQRDDWNRRYATSEFIWTEEANTSLKLELIGMTPGVALDLAAGEGRNAVWLCEQGWQVHAVDFSEVALEKAAKLAAQRGVSRQLTTETSDLLNFIPRENGFDLVIIFYLQVPMEELRQVLRTAARAVAPEGTLLLVGHDSDNLRHGTGGPQDPEVLYTADDVAGILAGTLSIEKASRIERPVRRSDGMRVAIDCLVRASRSELSSRRS